MALVQTSSSCSDDEDGGFRFFWFPTFGGKSTEDIISVTSTFLNLFFTLPFNVSFLYEFFTPL